jgi:hypothetical protein
MNFSQRDPRWAADQLGTSSYTIGQAGCLITAAASMLTDFCCNTDPHRLNIWLHGHNGYASDCLLRFYALAGLGADVIALIRPPKRPDALILSYALAHGMAVLAEILPHPNTPNKRHWVRLLELEAETWRIMDPWRAPEAGGPAGTTTLAAAYPEATIRSAVTYRANAARVIPFTAEQPGPQQRAVAQFKEPAEIHRALGPVVDGTQKVV